MYERSHEGSRTAGGLSGVQGTALSWRREGYAAVHALVRGITLIVRGGPETDMCGVG